MCTVLTLVVEGVCSLKGEHSVGKKCYRRYNLTTRKELVLIGHMLLQMPAPIGYKSCQLQPEQIVL